MKKISFFIFILSFTSVCKAQVNHAPPNHKPDTGKIDSVQVEKIEKMPMDSLNSNKLSPSPFDTMMHKQTGDDKDPKLNDHPKKRE
jgi:hypothetical protein